MDPRFPASREDLYNLQMELKQVQYTQNSHAERLMRLEKRQADDAALKSVWNSPFPGVLSGTPQHGPVQIPQNEIFDDLDEQGEQLLGSLHLGPAEEEPVRRGAASRANSVRFDESALHGSSWGGQNSRHSGEFAPIRPGSGLMMERSLSHKSDGRHSSAGHSVHSVHSHHSAASGRASSLGLDTNYAVDDDDSDSFEIPEPPPSLFVLGTVPSIIRCWLTTNFAHATLLYADVCTGAQKSTVDYSLLEELDLLDEIHHDVDGAVRVRLNVYFAEASVTHHGNRAGSPRGPVPSITVYFEVSGIDRSAQSAGANPIRIFLGSDALRAHSADILFSKNVMTLYDDERDRLRVPFVRPEDQATFRNICTANIVQEKHKLNANAAPFILGETISAPPQDEVSIMASSVHPDDSSHSAMSPMGTLEEPVKPSEPYSSASDTGVENDKLERDANGSESGSKGSRRESGPSEAPRRDASGIWGSWRHGTVNGGDSARENGLSGYQPAGRGTRNMKVLKPMKSSSSSARTGASYEPPPPTKGLGEGRRKSQVNLGADKENGVFPNRWDTKRTASIGSEPKLQAQAQPPAPREVRQVNTLPRSANPVGGASAFSWMTPSTKSKTTAGMD